jgi:hypothetical protein
MIDWYIEGVEFGNCNCAYGCPCQFEAESTYGDCFGFEVVRIEKGHFGKINLDGLKAAMLYSSPDENSGEKAELQVIIDEGAGEQQRHALETILHGKETEQAATHWWVYCMLADIIHPTLYKPIEFEMDIESRTAQVVIPGILESTGRPIRSPHSNKEHRVQISITRGIEFELAEMGSGTTISGSESIMDLNITDRYGQFNVIRHSGTGVVHSQGTSEH